MRHGDRAQDLSVTIASDERVDALAKQISWSLYGQDDCVLWCERRGRALEPDARVDEAGIIWGDTLRVLQSGDIPDEIVTGTRFKLSLTGGPMAGTFWPLDEGQCVIGRDPSSDLQIADRSLSRTHARFEAVGATVTVTDLESSNGVSINGRRVTPGIAAAVGPQDEIEMGRTLIRVLPTAGAPEAQLKHRAGRLEFNRPPRVRRTERVFRKELDAPPNRKAKARLPLATALIPLIGGVVLVVVTKQVLFLAMVALSPLMAVASYVGSRRDGSRGFAGASDSFRKSLDRGVQELDEALLVEADARRNASPDLPSVRELARQQSPTLWERRREDPDFLSVRIGVADLETRASMTLKPGGDEQLREAALATLQERARLNSVPFDVSLTRGGIVGLAGPRALTRRVATAMLVQAACMHSPADVIVAAAVGDDTAHEWAWLKWLPHLPADRVGLRRSIATGKAEAAELLTDIRDLVADRLDRPASAAGAGDARCSVLLLLDEDVCVDRALLTASLGEAGACRVHAIWLGHDSRDLPGLAGTIVEIESNRAVAKVTDVASGEVTDEVSVDGLESAAAEETARALAPLLDVSERSRSGDLPTRVSLLDLLDLTALSPDALEARWKSWNGRPESTIGVSADGPVTIDLRADGPHALIAGTTGSGKSELLRTFVAAAAATAPPDQLTFLLIDYKGGAAFAPCRHLPHVLDVISDLDAHMAERALISLEAELKRRERILAQTGAKNLIELQLRDRAAAPPMLIIAVDEFAKLRENVPEFVDGVVDIAQRGRSLGVHMVLAAQTLSNALTPAIRANTNLRIALRVADESESADVINSPIAAHVPSGDRHRGRAFARTGHGELREIQTAYVSGRSANGASQGTELTALGLNGPVRPISTHDGSADNDEESDLTALADVARSVERKLALEPPVAPWLPPLASLLDLETLPHAEARPGCAVIGLIDLPASQRQDPLVIDLPAAGNVVAFGGAGSGKTTLLTTTALALSGSAGPSQLRIYGIEAGPGELSGLEGLPQCGGVLKADDLERVERLFRTLVERLDAAASTGADTEAQQQRLTLLLLDDLGSFLTTHQTGPVYEQLERILAGGRKAGIHVLASAAQRSALPTRLAAHFGQRLALRMPTDDDLVALGLDRKRVRDAVLPPGRGFTQQSDEFQVAVPCLDGQATKLATAAARARDVHSGQSAATRIGTLPQEVERASLGVSTSRGQLPLGLADAGLKTASVDLSEMHFMVVGPYRSGRSTALVTLALGLRDAAPADDLFLLAPRRNSALRELEIWKASATTTDACGDAADGLLQRLKGNPPNLAPAIVFIDDAGELSDPTTSTKLEQVLKLGRDQGLVVVAAVETSAARGIAVPWIRELRRDGHGLLLQPDLLADGDLLGVRLPRRVAAPMVPGRGFLVSRGITALVQVGL